MPSTLKGELMGCHDNWGRSEEEMKRGDLEKARGYFKGGLGAPDQCRRCGSMVDFMSWKEHDIFHLRVDASHEREHGFGVFSEHFKEKHPDLVVRLSDGLL